MAEIKFNADGSVVGSVSTMEKEAGVFEAPPLTCTLTDPDGNVVGSFDLEARAYKPDDKGMGGIGWFAALPSGDDALQHPKHKMYLSGQVRISVLKKKGARGLKIKASDALRFE